MQNTWDTPLAARVLRWSIIIIIIIIIIITIINIVSLFIIDRIVKYRQNAIKIAVK